MEEKTRCQSCGMPLGLFGEAGDNFALEADGSRSEDYCKFCYKEGGFVMPDLTLEEMLQMSRRQMMKDLNFSEEKARRLADGIIPGLKRWKEE